MHKRTFLLHSVAALAFAGAALTGCTTTGTAGKADAGAQRTEIDTGIDSTLSRLYAEVKGSRELVGKADGVLVFPRVISAGLVVGGEHGKGAMRVKGADHQQSGVFALRPGVGLQGNTGETRDFRKPILQLLKDGLVTARLAERRERMDAAEFRPGDREHFRSRVQLHRA